MPLGLIEGSSRKRRPNWTDQECLLLAQLMQDKKAIIRGKCSTGVSTQDKRQAWEEIAQVINNTFPQIQRTVSDCNKKWENLLAKSREEIKRQKRQEGTGKDSLLFVIAITLNLQDLREVVGMAAEIIPVEIKSKNTSRLFALNLYINNAQHDFSFTEGVSHEQFSAVTQLVIAVMNLSDMLQRGREDSSVTEFVETHQRK